MNTTPTLVQVRPRDHQRYRDIPIFGRLLDDFVPWAFGRGYTIHTVYLQLDSVRRLAVWVRKHAPPSLGALTADDLAAAHRCFSTRRDPRYAWGLRGFGEFLQANGYLKPGRPKSLSRSEHEAIRFVEHLRKDRGAAESTCSSCQRRVRHFLKFLGFERHKTFKILTLATVHRYLRKVSDQFHYQRKTMGHVVGSVRAFLRFQFMRGVIHRPLHAQIDTVRIYRDEQLPYPVQWSELQHLLRLIDRSTPRGLRDYAVLLIAATYGMRASDVANLTVDDVDWRERTLQIVQCKTRQPLSLPLTDEVGAALADYLREARPACSYRQIFLRLQAPIGPLSLPGVSNTLRHASQTAGVTLKAAGFRCLRHALALRLLRRGASTKDIGDIFGHRSTISTSVYLRLDVEDLRQVALPVPRQTNDEGRRKMPSLGASLHNRIGARTAPHRWDWCSFLRKPMTDYLAVQRALGRGYVTEERTLRGLDFFLVKHYPITRSLSAPIFAAWADGLRSLCPTTARMRMLCVRKFCCYLARSRSGVFIPDLRTFPKELPHQAPYLLSESEVAASWQPPPHSTPRETTR